MSARGVNSQAITGWNLLGASVSVVLLLMLLLPAAVLFASTSLGELKQGLADPLFGSAFLLSVKTSLWSLGLTLLTATPLAWWLARSSGGCSRTVALVVNLPIVMPPAVVGVALLATFGRRGVLGATLDEVGLSLAFSQSAVVIAQLVVSAPFYIQAAATAFRKVDPELLSVARSLGATAAVAWVRVAVPIALPGLIAGASLCWARALGEFGATLLFAGNLRGVTQTLPLAIFSALESNVRLAVVFSLVLTALGGVLLVGLRAASWRLFTGGQRCAATRMAGETPVRDADPPGANESNNR